MTRNEEIFNGMIHGSHSRWLGVDIENPVDEEFIFNKEHFQQFGIVPWTLFTNSQLDYLSNHTVYKLISGSTLSKIKLTDLFYELMFLNLADTDNSYELIVLEPLMNITTIDIDYRNFYSLNGVLITTNVSGNNNHKWYIHPSRGSLSSEFDDIWSASDIFSTWENLIDYIIGDHGYFFNEYLSKGFLSVIKPSKVSLANNTKDLVFDYAEKYMYKYFEIGHDIKNFRQLFKIKPASVRISVPLDLRGIYTHSDLDGIELLDLMKPAWYSELDEFKKVLRQNKLDKLFKTQEPIKSEPTNKSGVSALSFGTQSVKK